MKKYPIFYTFCYFILSYFGIAADWAPASLEGIFAKITFEAPEQPMNVLGYQITIPSSKETYYTYTHNSTMYWGFEEEHMLAPLFFDYQKTSSQSFDLEF